MSFPYPKPFAGASQSAAVAEVDPADAFFARLDTPPDANHEDAYRTLIGSLVDTGVWANLDALYIYAAADQATALTNLVQDAYGGTAMNSIPFTADVGYGLTDTTATTHFLKTGFDPSTAGGKWALNSASCFVWFKDDRSCDAKCMNTPDAHLYLYAKHTFGNNIYGNINTMTNDLNPDNSHPNNNSIAGLTLLTRTGQSTRVLYNDTDVVGSAAPGNGVGSLPVGELTFFNQNGGSPGTTNNCIRAAGMGAGMTAQNVSDLKDALTAYFAAL